MAAEACGGLDTAIVGHMPDVAGLAAALIGDGRAALRFGKAAVAAIRFADLPAIGQGELLWFAAPEGGRLLTALTRENGLSTAFERGYTAGLDASAHLARHGTDAHASEGSDT
ncbi:MAG: hypothetical protein QM811_05140 [Pirellulales bacterium]